MDMAEVPESTARELVERYEPLVRRMAFSFRFADQDELWLVGRIGIIEAFVTFREHHGVPIKQWTQVVVRQRMVGVMERAKRIRLREHHYETEPATNGRSDPERAHLMSELMNALVHLSPRHQAVISGRIRGQTLEQVGEQLGISTARVHQEQKAALAHLLEITDFDYG